MDAYKEALYTLVDAIEQRYSHETDRKRENALGPRIEEVLTAAKELIGYKRQESEIERKLREAQAELAAAKAERNR